MVRLSIASTRSYLTVGFSFLFFTSSITLKNKTTTLIRLAKQNKKVRQAHFRSLKNIARPKAKIKAFRSQFRGVKNVELFIYRLTTILTQTQLLVLIYAHFICSLKFEHKKKQI